MMFKIAEDNKQIDAEILVTQSKWNTDKILIEIHATDNSTKESSGAGIRLNPYQARVLARALLNEADRLWEEGGK